MHEAMRIAWSAPSGEDSDVVDTRPRLRVLVVSGLRADFDLVACSGQLPGNHPDVHVRLVSVRVVFRVVLGVVRSMNDDALAVVERPPPAVLLVFVDFDACHGGTEIVREDEDGWRGCHASLTDARRPASPSGILRHRSSKSPPARRWSRNSKRACHVGQVRW